MDSNGGANGVEQEASRRAIDAQNFPPERTVALLIDHAVAIGASDVFFSCSERDVEVSARHLGVIRQIALLPLEAGHRCMTHIRAAAGMKYHEKRLPQDGRWLRRLPDGRIIDLRLNSMPTLYGESFAIRLLERNSQLRSLEALGLVGNQLDALKGILHSPSGLVLVTGPTGSGKTTTLYACLEHLNDGRRKIHTIEDPVEYTLPGLRQSQVEDGTGADYLMLLRSVLRQGPDVIMIGEIRDRPTAETAIRAANSGQLVFATLHAPVAAAAVQSLLSLDIPSYFICTSLLGVIGERLVRTLNPENRVPVDLSDAPRTFEEVRQFLEPGQGNTVYAAAPEEDGVDPWTGRTGVFEMMCLTPRLRRMIREMAPAAALAREAAGDGMLDFRRAALVKVAQGTTSFDEMFRVIPTGDLWIDD